MGEGDTLLNAAIGAAVGLLLSFLPAAIVIGGALAGYLQDIPREYREGAKVGALAGVFALVPVLLLFGTVGSFLLFDIGPRFDGMFSVFGSILLFFGAGYFVGGGALGGALGAYLADEL